MIWPLLPTDRAGLALGYEHLDERSRYHRFLTQHLRLTEPMLTHLVDEVDGIDHVALVAVVFDDLEGGVPAGVGRMIRLAEDPTAADVAVTVAGPYRGRGVASALLSELLAQRPRGVERVVTKVAADNPASLAMLERLGPTEVTAPEDNIRDVVVQLPAP